MPQRGRHDPPGPSGRTGRPTRPGPSGLPVGDLPVDGPPTVDLPVPGVALAIGAHPDDIEFGSGGTLAKWAAAGCRVHHLVLTDGSKGSWDPETDPAALAVTREEESRAAASVIDGGPGPDGTRADRVAFLGRIDGTLVNGPSEQTEIAAVIRRVKPEVVLGHDPWRRYRLHPDHRAAGFATVDAVVAARDPHYLPEIGTASHRPDALLLWEADLPNHVENVVGFESTKIDALLCHSSQYTSTMAIDRSATGENAPTSRTEFEARVRHQLADHGWFAGTSAGEAYRLIGDV